MLITRSSWISFVLHALLVLVLCWFSFGTPPGQQPIRRPSRPLVFQPRLKTGPGRGGGAQSQTPATHGSGPVTTRRTFTPPAVMTANYAPKLLMPKAMDAPPSLDTGATNIGDPDSLLEGLSGGPGGPRGIGGCTGPSIGNGHGRDGAVDGGAFRAGHGVTMPVPIHKVEPEYSEMARKAKMSGVVLVACIVGADGLPRNLEVLRSIGLGLDEKAIEAVSRWRFRPGVKDGQAVAVKAVIEVSFRIL